MRTIRLGRTEALVPAVSLGTWAHGGPNRLGDLSVGWSGHDDRAARAALVNTFEAGITHWDTADVYGNGRSEELIGGVWGDVPRDAVFLATKVGWDAGEFPDYYHPKQIVRQLEGSLRRLRSEVIDLYYLHHCQFGPDEVYLDDALEQFHRARDAGKIRFIGLSDWSSEAVMRVADRVAPDVVQPLRNVTADAWESSGLRAWVEEHDVGVAFFSPIRHGLLLGKYAQPTTFPEGDFRRNDEGFGDAALIAGLIRNRDRLAERFADRAQPVIDPLLGALLEDAPTACVLLGMRNPQQVEAAAACGEPLSAADAAWVREIYRELQA